MKNLLTGNGINIQFDNKNYTSQQIVLRILKNCDRDDFPTNIIINDQYLLKNYMGELYIRSRDIIDGEYDKEVDCTAESLSLKSFKDRYSKRKQSLRITDIGFEDYYLIHDLICHKINIQNPERYNVREAMKTAYLYSIYNDGELNKLFDMYPSKFTQFLKNFNNVFTMNYDSNIESATDGKMVYHLHGQFDKKAAVYDPCSFRNQLPDCPIKDHSIDEKYYYLYSNALTDHCGEYKEFQLKKNSQATVAVTKMAKGYNTDIGIRNEVDDWIIGDNKLTANLGCAVKLKAANPELNFSDDYHLYELQSITGTLEIIGLSPWNDFHIFDSIDKSSIEECKYYYFDNSQCEIIKSLLPKLDNANKLIFEAASDFWERCYET